MKTSELTGAQLDFWVANAEGFDITRESLGEGRWFQFHPSTNWAQGGLIIERERILSGVYPNAPELGWNAQVFGQERSTRGETLLIAAMRAYVASKFGDEVRG